jgi:endonuclease YncB( thermonuclease family)
MFAAGLAAGVLLAQGIVSPNVKADTPPLAPAGEPARPASPPREAARGAPESHPADVLRVLDGDTFEARVRVWPGIEITTKVRLRGIDAPEMKARCPEERTKAEAARDALRALLAEGDVAVARVGFDKYGGRVLADAATRATPDVGNALLIKGLARPYSGGHRESWCGGL